MWSNIRSYRRQSQNFCNVSELAQIHCNEKPLHSATESVTIYVCTHADKGIKVHDTTYDGLGRRSSRVKLSAPG